MMFCCPLGCPNLPACADLAEAVFARPEEIADEADA